MELATKLAASPDVHACFATQWLRFAYGIEESAETACLVEEIGQKFEKDGLKIEDLIVSLTLAPRFAQRSIDDGVGGETSGSSGAGGAMSTGATSGGSSVASSSSGGPVMSDLEVEKTFDSQWATGYQMSVKVTNKSAAKITWSVTFAVDGKITDLWNANSVPAGAQTTFTGKDFNATLDPGASASFGFVATK